MKTNNMKRFLLFLFIIFTGHELLAQASSASSSKGGMDMNWVLAFVALLLTLPIFILSKTFIFILKDKMRKEKEKESNAGKAVMTILFFFSAFSGFAQDALVKPKIKDRDIFDVFSNTTWLLIFTIVLELIIILFLSIKTVSAIRPEKEPVTPVPDIAEEKPNKLKLWLNSRWDKWNNFTPIEQEDNIDTGHSYDGIRELDNPTPIWFKAAFGLCILFAVVYLYRYHVAKSAPLPAEEYAIAVKAGEAEHQLYLKTQGEAIDENNVKMLDASAITTGKAIFKEKCATCHMENGAGNNGPNLTDDYWIHGGSLSSVFKSIKYGWVEKGMQPWQQFLSAKQMAQLASFVKSIKGTNPPNGKAPEGDLYKEETETTAVTPIAVTAKVADTVKATMQKDTIKPKK